VKPVKPVKAAAAETKTFRRDSSLVSESGELEIWRIGDLGFGDLEISGLGDLEI
jgi:hypothetical protein